MTDATENHTESITISFAEAVSAVDAIEVAWDEGMLRNAAARLGLRLIDTFGDRVISPSSRSWFRAELEQQLKEDPEDEYD